MQAMFKKALLLALVLPVLTASAASEGSTSATSAETMQLSSWRSEVVGGSIVGGIQTVTIVSTAATSNQSVAFRLEGPPCDCSVSTVIASIGVVEHGIWTIDDLQPGAIASLEVTYGGGQ
jgi:hypothetical protein